MYLLRWNQDPAPRQCYCFLAASPLSLHLLSCLISNCLNLPFETRGESHGGWSLFPKNKEVGTKEGFHAQELHRVLSSFII